MIGIIGAMDVEVRMLQDDMTEKKETKIGFDIYIQGNLYGKPAVVVQCGPGKVNAAICTQNMINMFHPDRIVNVGVAGAGSKEIHVGDVVIGTSAVQHDMDTSPIGDPVGLVSKINLIRIPCDDMLVQKLTAAVKKTGMGGSCFTGVIATGDHFINDESRRNRIHEMFDSLAVEMEGAAVAHACYVNNIPCGILRTISDESNGESPLTYADFARQAAEQAQKVIRNFMGADRL